MDDRDDYSISRRIPIRGPDDEASEPLALPAGQQGEESSPAGLGENGNSGDCPGIAAASELEEQEPETATQPPPAASPVDVSEGADLQAQLAELEERWKRAAADLDNYRKRFERELERLRQAERATILREWLAVVDNMERALCAQGASENPWYEGMEAIHQQMLAVLAQFGVEPFVPMGEEFDPRRHEAVATANLPDQPEGKIVEVIQTGYLLDGEVLRPAKVIAVKHG